MTSREADGTDKIVCYERGEQIFAKLAGSAKSVHRFLNATQAVNFVFDTPGVKTFVVDETYLVAYTVVGPWSLDLGLQVVQELLIARIYDGGGTFDGVMDFLESEAKLFQCIGVVVGSALTRDDRAFAKVLSAHGFTPLSWEHFKPVE